MTHLPDMEKARRFLAARGPANPLAVGVTGSHFYGFPSADSDLDLKGIHVAPTAELVGLSQVPDSLDFLGDFDGLEVDFTSQELAQALRLLIKGNGNILERIATRFQVVDHDAFGELRSLVQGAISRRFYRHYRGFFGAMVEEVLHARPPTAKALLYAYRTALTGIHLLSTGECVADAEALAEEHRFTAVKELLEIKRGGVELAEVSSADPWIGDFARLEGLLEDARDRSRLPEQSANVPALNDFLIRMRRRYF